FAILMLLILSPASRARGNDSPSLPAAKTEVDPVAAEIAAARKRIARVPCDPKIQTTMTVIPLARLKPEALVKDLEHAFAGRPGFAVAAIPSLGVVVLRADATTTALIVNGIGE